MDPVADRLLIALDQVAATSATSMFDAVVVGGGSAGITVARTLHEAGLHVALLEAGPLSLLTHVQSTDLRFDPDVVRAIQQALSYSPKAASNATYGSLIGCLGGRGLFWNGAAPRFSAEDFAEWPIALAELEAFYEWAETQFRVTTQFGAGRLSDLLLARLKAAGLDARLGPYAVDCHETASGWLAGTIGNSLAPLLRSTAATTANRISISTRAFVRKILVTGGAAAGVEAVDLATGKVHQIIARSVVLAAGAFESTRLALVSGLPDPHGLIGRYISDHNFVRAYFPMNPADYAAKPEVSIIWIPAAPTRNFQIEIHLPSDNLFLVKEDTVWAPNKSVYYAAMVRSFAPLQPRASNFVEALPGDAPGSYRVTMSLDADDQSLAAAQMIAVESVRSAIGADPAQVVTLPLGASHHEAGGLIMGREPGSSVTDPFGRFWSTTRLVACDSASWPNVSAANPHLTIVAMARRQAAQLAAEL
jgi:choline dehydrogenase-like flavoprotein